MAPLQWIVFIALRFGDWWKLKKITKGKVRIISEKEKAAINKRVKKATKQDKGHTKKFSDWLCFSWEDFAKNNLKH